MQKFFYCLLVYVVFLTFFIRLTKELLLGRDVMILYVTDFIKKDRKTYVGESRGEVHSRSLLLNEKGGRNN